MAINPPAWCKDAVPTTRGWAHARTGELLKAQPIAQADIDVWHGVRTPAPVKEGYQKLDSTFKPVTLTESPTNEEEFSAEHLENMSKRELEEVGREYGVELDRREKKSTLVEKVKGLID